MKGVDVIAKILGIEGVEYLTCFPHSEIIDACAAEGIRPILARQERTALHIADGYSRMNDGRKIGVATVQYGPGSENAFGAIAQTYGDASPVLYLPTGYPRSQRGVAPNFDASLNLRHITKWGEAVSTIDRIPQMMEHAFAQLRNGKPGPVMIETSVDILAEDFGNKAIDYTPPRRSAPQCDPKDIDDALDALLGAKAPVIVAGQGIFYARACNELKVLAELLQIPVMTTLNGKSAFPENHPLALGTGALSRPRTVDHFLAKADLVFGIGTSFTRSGYITAVPDGKTIAQITNCEADIGKDYPVSFGAVGDAKAALRQLIDGAKARLGEGGRAGDDAVVREVKGVRDAFMAEWMPRLTATDEPISPYRVVWDLMQVVDRSKTVVTHDAGNPRDQTTLFYEAIVPHGYIGWGKTTQLGTGLGLAMGAKLAQPDWLSVNIMGDAAFGMVGLDVETAVRCRLPVLTIVFKNSVMGGYTGHLPVAAEKFDIHRLSGDYAKVGEAMGAYAETVERVDDLKPTLLRGIEQVNGGRTAVIEVVTREEPNYPTG
jgi:acetolactate synthase-1/2/3 large subunit